MISLNPKLARIQNIQVIVISYCPKLLIGIRDLVTNVETHYLGIDD